MSQQPKPAVLAGVRPGDTLILTDVNKPHRRIEVTVHKVGRTLVHVLRHNDRPDLGTDAFRLDDGRRNDAYGHQHLERPATTREQQ